MPCLIVIIVQDPPLLKTFEDLHKQSFEAFQSSFCFEQVPQESQDTRKPKRRARETQKT